jgi:uncharacterized protein YjcR
VKDAITQCCRQLKKRIHQQALDKEQEERKKNMFKYIPNVSRAIFSTLQMISETKSKQENQSNPILQQVTQKKLTEKSLSKSLETFIQKVDADAALEYASSQGSQKAGSEHIFLGSIALEDATRYVQSESGGFRILFPSGFSFSG